MKAFDQACQRSKKAWSDAMAPDNLIVSFKLDLIKHRRRSASHGRSDLRGDRFPLAGFRHWKPEPKREMERVARTLGVRGYQTWKA